METKEVLRAFLARFCEHLGSLPFDLKILQEAVADADLERGTRELAAGVVIHALGPHEGSGPERFIEDVLLVRLALEQVRRRGGEEAAAFAGRFPEVYEGLDADLALFARALGPELWGWLEGRVSRCSQVPFKGKRAAGYVADEEALDALYEDGLAFQTNYDVTEAQVQNRLRRPEQLIEHLHRRRSEEQRRKG
jgi:hypothetical protein